MLVLDKVKWDCFKPCRIILHYLFICSWKPLFLRFCMHIYTCSISYSLGKIWIPVFFIKVWRLNVNPIIWLCRVKLLNTSWFNFSNFLLFLKPCYQYEKINKTTYRLWKDWFSMFFLLELSTVEYSTFHKIWIQYSTVDLITIDYSRV